VEETGELSMRRVPARTPVAVEREPIADWINFLTNSYS
jgi:hypothetical protein